jgi:Ion channel
VIDQLLLATVMVVVTVLMHGIGISRLALILRFDPSTAEAHHHFSPRHAAMILAIVLALFTLHAVEIWLYAGLYLLLNAVVDLETAVYFSTITYAGIGFDDGEMAKRWRLVSAIEGVNGILLLGWSTAFFVTVVARLRR